MLKRILILLAAVFLIFIFTGSSFALNIIEKNENQIFEIQLLENSSTGYIWDLEIEDEKIVRLIDVNKRSLKKADQRLAGAPDIKTWTFEAKNKGVVELNFNLQRMGSPENREKELNYLIAVDIPVIRLSENSVEKISLFEKPNSGYKWHLSANEDFLRILKTDYMQIEKNDSIVDTSPRVKNWYISKKKNGYTIIEFKLYRRWEQSNIKARKLFLITAEQ